MSKTQEESEISLMTQIIDPAALQEADAIEDHIQLESRLESGTKIRVRKITPVKGPHEGQGARYELTMKQKVANNAGIPSSLETNTEVDRNFFENFAGAANRAIVKRRYSFTGLAPRVSLHIPAVTYEVDEFTNPNTGAKASWYKVDIELDGVLKALKEQGIDTAGLRQKFDLSGLPFTCTNMFSTSDMTDEQKKFMDNLWPTELSKDLRSEQSNEGTSA